MSDLVLVHVIDGTDDLLHEDRRLHLREVTRLDDPIEELATVAELHDEVDVSVQDREENQQERELLELEPLVKLAFFHDFHYFDLFCSVFFNSFHHFFAVGHRLISSKDS